MLGLGVQVTSFFHSFKASYGELALRENSRFFWIEAFFIISLFCAYAHCWRGRITVDHLFDTEIVGAYWLLALRRAFRRSYPSLHVYQPADGLLQWLSNPTTFSFHMHGCPIYPRFQLRSARGSEEYLNWRNMNDYYYWWQWRWHRRQLLWLRRPRWKSKGTDFTYPSSDVGFLGMII